MCRLRLFFECSDGSMGFAEHIMRYEDDIVGFIKHWKTGGRIVITEHIDLVQREIMKKNETYFVARLIKKGEFLSSEIFESLEEARLWAMKEAKLLISDLEMLRMTNVGDICVEIDKHFFGYEISSEELLKNSARVL